MPPCKSSGYVAYGGLTNTKLLSHFALRCAARNEHAYFLNSGRGKFGYSNIFTSCISSLFVAVFHVVSRRSKEKMVDINACGVVAMVTDKHAARYFSECLDPCKSVRQNVFPFVGRFAVSVFVFGKRGYDAVGLHGLYYTGGAL